jgi:hypothetical protein
VNMVMNIQVPPPKKNIGKFLSSWATGSF